MAEQYTILVGTTKEVLRRGCSLVLKSEGFRIVTAVNGREAMDRLATESVQVVLCDLKMPVMGLWRSWKRPASATPTSPSSS